MKYIESIQSERKLFPNVVIKIGDHFFAKRNPDSGLVIDEPFSGCVQSWTINPSSVDITNVTTTIASFTFKLVDLENAVTGIVKGDAKAFAKQPVSIWLGLSEVGMDFSEYFKLPPTRVQKISRPDNAYSFSTTEDIERMQRPIYDQDGRLAAAILPETTILVMDRDISEYPSSGLLKIDAEYMSYTGVDLALRRFTGVVRGELNTVPAEHALNADVYAAETLTGNPVDMLLKIATSKSGTGEWDVLRDGLGISIDLFDIEDILRVRNSRFSERDFKLTLCDEKSGLEIIEKQILEPLGLRFTYSINSKVTLAVLDKAVFVDEIGSIDETSITKPPAWELDCNKITNVIKISWDFDEATETFGRVDYFRDYQSIEKYGEQKTLSYEFKGPRLSRSGEKLVNYFASRLLARVSQPIPEVTISTQLDKSLRNIGDKTYIKTDRLPAVDGSLNFSSEMEVISRTINSSDAQLKLAFTSFTNIRSGYIAPSDIIEAVVDARTVVLRANRGLFYKVGWRMRMWDVVTMTYLSDGVNEIEKISGDTITFKNQWVSSPIIAGRHKIRFSTYDDATESQKRYCFISKNTQQNFDDGKLPYSITF